jgi:DNA-binding MarR family transcriptional regulator
MEVFMGLPLTDDLSFLLARASGQVVRAANGALAEHGLRVRSYSVLTLTCEDAGGLSQREIAAVLGLDPSQVVLLVDDLAAAGLVERQASESDRRTRLVVPTAAGRRVREDAGRAVDAGPPV